MFTPLNEAFEATVVIWSRRDLKSVFRDVRLVASSEVSEAARALAFICCSRLEICVPADMATSMVDWARFSESFTASNEETLPCMVLAIAHTAPLSLAVLIFLPVEMVFCVAASSAWVEFRLNRAVSAAWFVLMLIDIRRV